MKRKYDKFEGEKGNYSKTILTDVVCKRANYKYRKILVLFGTLDAHREN